MVGEVAFLFQLMIVFVFMFALVPVFLLLQPFLLYAVKQQHKNVPPGSMECPIIGETLSFLSPHKSNTLGRYLQDRCTRYGRIFKSHLFFHPTIVSCDHAFNMFILQNEEKLVQGSYPKSIHGVLGDLSLFCIVGDHHKRLRNFALNLTNTCKSKVEYINDVDRLTISVMESWKNKKELNFCEEMKKGKPSDESDGEASQSFLLTKRGSSDAELGDQGRSKDQAKNPRKEPSVIMGLKFPNLKTKKKHMAKNHAGVTVGEVLPLFPDKQVSSAPVGEVFPPSPERQIMETPLVDSLKVGIDVEEVVVTVSPDKNTELESKIINTTKELEHANAELLSSVGLVAGNDSDLAKEQDDFNELLPAKLSYEERMRELETLLAQEKFSVQEKVTYACQVFARQFAESHGLSPPEFEEEEDLGKGEDSDPFWIDGEEDGEDDEAAKNELPPPIC